MTDFADWRSFDYDTSEVQLWVFKKSTTDAKFRAWHVRTDEQVEELFRDAIKSETSRITETIAYSHISQNNESSCLEHPLEQSEGLIALLQVVDVPEAENADAKLKQLKGAVGYLVKFRAGDSVVYAVRKTAPSWRATVRKKMINAIFANGELSVAPDESFSFDAYFDFYCFNETIFVSSKRTYESTVADKVVYQKGFEDLTVDCDFTNLFTDLEPLKRYVGKNAMHLRRMTVVQQKALYNRPGFSERLKVVSETRGWGLKFDDDGRITVCEETAKVVIQVLLDHRLLSEVTDNTYDVPDAQIV